MTQKCADAGLTVEKAGKLSGIPDLERQLERTIPLNDHSRALAQILKCSEAELTTADPENWGQVSPTEWGLTPGQ
ncbi:hypothetical protein [Rhodococcus sp. NPDC006774]|uniref:hypothetical protein n=1 Tax=Rhodococcus sp. NPDC006774 TaxID=3157186 RepID=UPI0033FF8467